MMILYALALFAFLLVPQHVYAEWTPLIQATDFDGIKTDVLSTAAGVVTILLIIVGLGILIRALNR
jgi:hypothetical protein